MSLFFGPKGDVSQNPQARGDLKLNGNHSNGKGAGGYGQTAAIDIGKSVSSGDEDGMGNCCGELANFCLISAASAAGSEVRCP